MSNKEKINLFLLELEKISNKYNVYVIGSRAKNNEWINPSCEIVENGYVIDRFLNLNYDFNNKEYKIDNID